MKFLLDTHAALFAWAHPERLSTTARQLIEDRRNVLLFSQVSTWEICLKHQVGKLTLPDKPRIWLPKRIRQSEFTYEPISDQAMFGAADLPLHHLDPFDRLLVATARQIDVPLITADEVLRKYEVDVVW